MKKLLWIICFGLIFTTFTACGDNAKNSTSNGKDSEVSGEYNPSLDGDYELPDDYFD